jgi:hypothetical protein
MEINYCLFTLLHDNESRLSSIVAYLRKRNVVLSHCYNSADVIEPREPHTCKSTYVRGTCFLAVLTFHHHHHQQGLGLLICFDLRVRRIVPSISSVVILSLFFLQGDSHKASEELLRSMFRKSFIHV